MFDHFSRSLPHQVGTDEIKNRLVPFGIKRRLVNGGRISVALQHRVSSGEEIMESVVKRDHDRQWRKTVFLQTSNRFVERQNFAAQPGKSLHALFKNIRCHEKAGAPLGFILERNSVVTEDQKPLRSPLAPLKRGVGAEASRPHKRQFFYCFQHPVRHFYSVSPDTNVPAALTVLNLRVERPKLGFSSRSPDSLMRQRWEFEAIVGSESVADRESSYSKAQKRANSTDRANGRVFLSNVHPPRV